MRNKIHAFSQTIHLDYEIFILTPLILFNLIGLIKMKKWMIT